MINVFDLGFDEEIRWYLSRLLQKKCDDEWLWDCKNECKKVYFFASASSSLRSVCTRRESESWPDDCSESPWLAWFGWMGWIWPLKNTVRGNQGYLLLTCYIFYHDNRGWAYFDPDLHPYHLIKNIMQFWVDVIIISCLNSPRQHFIWYRSFLVVQLRRLIFFKRGRLNLGLPILYCFCKFIYRFDTLQGCFIFCGILMFCCPSSKRWCVNGPPYE